MIKVTNLLNSEYVLNSDFIETIEYSPDTIITLTNGKKFIVRQSIDEIIQKIAEFRAQTLPINIKRRLETGQD